MRNKNQADAYYSKMGKGFKDFQTNENEESIEDIELFLSTIRKKKTSANQVPSVAANEKRNSLRITRSGVKSGENKSSLTKECSRNSKKENETPTASTRKGGKRKGPIILGSMLQAVKDTISEQVIK